MSDVTYLRHRSIYYICNINIFCCLLLHMDNSVYSNIEFIIRGEHYTFNWINICLYWITSDLFCQSSKQHLFLYYCFGEGKLWVEGIGKGILIFLLLFSEKSLVCIIFFLSLKNIPHFQIHWSDQNKCWLKSTLCTLRIQKT